MNRVLLVFQKNPEIGKVKTRLAVSVGDEKALEIYKKLIHHTRKVIEPVVANKQIWYSTKIEEEDEWDAVHYQKSVQMGKGLGERMSTSFMNAFSNPETGKVVIIGTDCAEITSKLIEQAFDTLESFDFVLGPAIDGGYYLLGMSQFYPSIFSDIPWSSEDVCTITMKRIESLGKSMFLLPKLSDIDTVDDWNRAKNIIDYI